MNTIVIRIKDLVEIGNSIELMPMTDDGWIYLAQIYCRVNNEIVVPVNATVHYTEKTVEFTYYE